MRKQTKLVAVLSAAALLAIGASMTSFAAGWQKNDDGSWSYFDNDDEMVTGEWKKDGSKWFYLDEDGYMLTDSWVDDEYYVDEAGAMIVNGWKKTISDDDVDDPDEDGDSWYYFDNKGKKVENKDKKIGGKTYFFDDEGKMRDGWYQVDDDEVYYLGEEDDGARKSGWLWLEMPSDDADEDGVTVNGHTDDCTLCDEEGWYYFGTDGKMYSDAKKKKVNGKYYYFGEHGQMLYEWINNMAVKAGTPSNAVPDGDNANATPSNMIYTNVVEEGWRADGWYQIDGAEDLDANNDTEWYYFKDGEAKKAELTDINGIKDGTTMVKRARIKVEGKYFCFNEKGEMQTGLQLIGDVETGKADMYYFDGSGYMKTGKVANAEEENDSFTYYFQTKSGGNGKGIQLEKDGYLHWFGKRLEADDDYRVFKVDGDFYLVNNKGKLQKSDSKKYDIENTGDEEVTFKFVSSGYKLNPTQTDAKAAAAIAKASVPKIELIDSVIVTNGTGNVWINDADDAEVTVTTPTPVSLDNDSSEDEE